VFILRMKNARHLDASTVMAMESLHEYLRGTGRYLLISGSNPEVTHVLENSGLLQQIGRENIFPAEANATVATRNALKRAKELLPGESVNLRVFYDTKKA
jgi:SulP family sulfate permease